MSKSSKPEAMSVTTDRPAACGARARSQRCGRVLIEVVLVILVPCACLATLALYDAELRKSLLSGSPEIPPRLANPVVDAVRIDDDKVLTAQFQGQLRLWTFSQKAQIGEMQSQITELSCIAYAPDQRLLAVCSSIGQVEVLDLDKSASQISEVPDLGTLHDVQFAPDGQTLLTAGEFGKVILWNPRTLERRTTWETPAPHEQICCLSISNDGQFVLAGTLLGRVHLWDLKQSQYLRSHQIQPSASDGSARIGTVAFFHGTEEFLAASASGGVGIWNVETGTCVRRFTGTLDKLKSGALSPDGTRFTAGTIEGQLAHWDTATGKLTGQVEQHPAFIKCLLHNTDSSGLLTADWTGRVIFRRP